MGWNPTELHLDAHKYTEETQAGGIGFRATPLIPWGFQIAHLSVKSHPGIAPSPSLTNTKHG